MNINPIRSGDSINTVSPLRSVKQSESQSQDIKTAKSYSNDIDNKIKADQNRQLKNETKIDGKQKEAAGQKKEPTIEEGQKLVDELNEYMDDLQTSLGFSVTRDDENPAQIVFQIKDRKTDEIIRQIPSEEIQKIKDKMNELTGLLLDQHA